MPDKPIFKPEFLQELADACPLGPCDPAVVQSWFDIHYPQMKQHHYTHWKRAVTNWWTRVRDGELEQAKARLDAIRAAQEDAMLEDLSRQVNRDPIPDAPRRRFRVVR